MQATLDNLRYFLAAILLPHSTALLGIVGFGVFVVTLLWALFPKRNKSSKALQLPVYRVTPGTDAAKLLEEAHAECPDEPFILDMLGLAAVILPTSEIETVKSLPESVLSIKQHHYNVFLGEYSYMGTKAEEFDATVRHTLTRNTPIMLRSFTTEIEYAIERSIGRCNGDWNPIPVRAAMSKVASLMSGRAFVGLPLSRDPGWVEATTNFTQDVSRAYIYLHSLSWWIKPFLAPLSGPIKSLMRHRQMNVEKLAPLLAKKQLQSSVVNKQGVVEANDTAGGELMDWFISRYEKPPTARQLARDQLLATFASIYNLSNALSYLMFDLAAHSKHVEQLRQELKDVIGENGTIDKANLPRLRKLDSFVRESQRMSPPSIANIPRVVTSPSGFCTSTGQVIPRGHTVMIRAEPINRSALLWSDPETFDGFRFSRLREQPGNDVKFQHVSTGTDNINFGHGIWACPGRFFASAQLKVVLAYILMHYDVRLVPGTNRPPSLHYGFAILPDSDAVVEFKSRKSTKPTHIRTLPDGV